MCSATEQSRSREIPRVNKARRRTILRHTTTGDNTMSKLHAALALGALLCLARAQPAQSAPQQGLAEHIRAVTAAVDGAFIRANARRRRDWPSYGLDYAETRFSKLEPDQRRQRQGARPGLVLQPRIHARRRGDAAGGRRHHVRHAPRGASCTRSTCAPASGSGRYDPEGPRESRATRAAATWSTAASRCYKGKVFVGAYDGRLIALDAATGQLVWEKDTIIDRSQLLHHHRRAARLQGQGDHRQRRRRVRRARLHHRLRRRDRRAEVALVHGAGRSVQALRGRVDGEGRQDLGPERQVLGGRRRRHRLGHAWPSIPTST